MDNKETMDIYLMGIGGTGMGAFAGLLKQKGHRVSGSDSDVFSPMKEKLAEWNIKFVTPYSKENVPRNCDLVIVGNVIRRENEEAFEVIGKGIPYDSFPRALNRLFLQDAIPMVAAGTHGKTTSSALLAHSLFSSGRDPGFLIGGIPINFGESFRVSQGRCCPFVVEGDEYDTAFFDKRPKFIHYDPKYLLITSLEFDHGDIYRDLDAVIDAFRSLLECVDETAVIAINESDPNIKRLLSSSATKAKIISYGPAGDYFVTKNKLHENGASFTVNFQKIKLGELSLPLFGYHNTQNALGCYALLHQYGLSHGEIASAFSTFKGTKRRLEEKRLRNGQIIIDDFAHHPTAVRETIKAAKQKYPRRKVTVIFEPRSATSCMKVFEEAFIDAFEIADQVYLAPLGRNLPKNVCLDTKKIADSLIKRGRFATAFQDYETLYKELNGSDKDQVLLFMSNGDFKGLLKKMEQG